MRIHCSNLNYETTADELKEAFSVYGKVEEAQIPQDHETGRSRGYGFLTMPVDNEAHAAIQALDGSALAGRKLRCGRAFERPRRPADNITQGELK